MDHETQHDIQEAYKDLIKILNEEDIEYSEDEDIRSDHSRDASIFTMTPQIVIYPRNSGEIGVVLRAIKPPLSVTPRAGGTCMTGSPLTESVQLNLTKHMSYIEVDPASKSAIVEMGAMYRDLEHKTMEHNLFFASYTSSKDICGVGGMIGNNASGEKSVRYGATIDNVYSLKAVLHDGFEYEFGEISADEFEKKMSLETLEGDVYRAVHKELQGHTRAIESLYKNHPVKKCASGYRIDRVHDAAKNTYNLASLFIGSQSTLGIITEAKIKLTEKQKYRKMIFMGIKTMSELPVILKTIMSHDPESVETFDIHTFERAKTFYPEHTNRIEQFVKGKKSSVLDAGFNLFVLAEFASNDEGIVKMQADKVIEDLNLLRDLRVFEVGCNNAENSEGLQTRDCVNTNVDTDAVYESIWKIRRTSFSVMRDFKDGTKHAVPCIEDVIVPIAKFDVFIPSLVEILNMQNIFFGYHGHIGDGSLRIIPVFDLADPDVVSKIDALCDAVFSLIKSLGGNMSADHSDGIIRTPYLREFYGDEIYNIFVAIKHTFDPENIFNPNKKIDGTLEDVKKFMIEV